jgi:succinate dehydrogenase / fumarate reductase, cytochrome b subunit
MTHFKSWISSSVGKKQVVGLTGFAIAAFALSHMAGNMLILVSAKAYNYYGHTLVTNPLLPVAEILLLVAFVVHIVFAVQLSIANRRARPIGNVSAGSGLKRASFASRSMILSGLLVLVFLILHLISFKYGTYYTVVYDGIEMRDLHRLIVEKFRDPVYFVWYLISLLVLGLHLSHGIGALLQSLGFNSNRAPWVRQVSWAFAIVIAGGFIAQPVWVMCCGGN